MDMTKFNYTRLAVPDYFQAKKVHNFQDIMQTFGLKPRPTNGSNTELFAGVILFRVYVHQFQTFSNASCKLFCISSGVAATTCNVWF